MGTRWGSWQLAEDLVAKDPAKEFHQFRSWDLIRVIHDQLKMLERGPLNTGGFPTPSVTHWIVSPVGENTDEVSRPAGEDVATFQVKPHEIQRICNHQQFGGGDRHYLGVQFTLWDGQLVITMMITVTVLFETLRIEVTGHALGPVHSLFTSKPAAKKKTVNKTVKFWETRDIALALVESKEVVRLALRAPSPGTRRSWTTSAARSPCRSPSGCGTPGPRSRGATASWPTTRCGPPHPSCASCTVPP